MRVIATKRITEKIMQLLDIKPVSSMVNSIITASIRENSIIPSDLDSLKAEAENLSLQGNTRYSNDKIMLLLLVESMLAPYLGEQSYAEWNGDTEDLALCGKLGLEGNAEAINEAKSLGKPTVACIIAGRNVIIDEQNRKNWDSIVMCYLPGSEGQGVANVLCGNSGFSGKLPSPWYSDLKQIGTNECWLKRGFGLTYQ